MNNIISDNSYCTISDISDIDMSHLVAGETRFDPTAPAPEGYLDALQRDGGPPLPEWAENPDRYLENEAKWWETYQLKLQKEMRVLARVRVRATRRYRGQTRARRAPASTRRATADSGGDDDGGSGDPEPPRPRCNVSQIFCGGASL